MYEENVDLLNYANLFDVADKEKSFLSQYFLQKLKIHCSVCRDTRRLFGNYLKFIKLSADTRSIRKKLSTEVPGGHIVSG